MMRTLWYIFLLCLLVTSCKKEDCLLTDDCSPSSYFSDYLQEQPVPTATGNVFFIDAENGNDENSGLSEQSAWQSVAALNAATLAPGDHVYFHRDQVHIGSIWLRSSGTASNRIVLSSYGQGEMPIVKHTASNETAVFLDGSDYVTVQNLNVHGGYTAIVLEEADQVILEGCRIGEQSTVGISARVRDGELDGSDEGIIQHCLIYSGLSGNLGDLQGTDGIQLGDGASRWEVHDNEIKAWAHTGINVFQIFSNAEEAYNDIHHNLFTCGDIDYMRAFSFQGGENGPHHNAFHHNLIRDQSVNSHLHGHDNVVSYNLFDRIVDTDASDQPHAVDFHVFRNRQSGAVIKNELVCHDNHFLNNLILDCAGPAIVFFKPMSGTDFTVTDNFVRNNMVIRAEAGIQLPPDTYQSTIEQNLFFSAAGAIPMVYNGAAEDLSAFESRNGNNEDVIQGNLEADPLLFQGGDGVFMLQAGSPAIDAGWEHDLLVDYYGNPMVGRPDIGAVEAQ